MEIHRPNYHPPNDFHLNKPPLHSPLRDDAYFKSQYKIIPSDITISSELLQISKIILDLTDFWDAGKYIISPVSGAVEIKSSLFIEKNSVFNYGYRQGAPEGISTLMWNSVEAISRFGTLNLRPGDEVTFTKEIDIGDKLLPGENKHGEGYYGTTNGMCNASTTLSELFGTNLILPDGSTVPIFIARPGAIQPHDMAHNPLYYEYAYHGPGVAVNSTPEGSLRFMVNPNLPKSILIQLGMSFTDTDPTHPYSGVYKPTATLLLSGIPDGYKIQFQRLSANRTAQLQKMTGSQEYYTKYGKSVYFDAKGNPIISDKPIVFDLPGKNKRNLLTSVIDQNTDLKTVQLERFKTINIPPSVNEFVYPGGYAHRASKDKNGALIWKTQDDWLPLNPDDLPRPLRYISASEYLKILKWNNVDNPNNLRYRPDIKAGTSYCNVAILDWAQAYRLPGSGESVPLPRWSRDTKMNANLLYDWLHGYQADALGWKKIDSKTAQERANEGYFTLAIAKNTQGKGHVAAVVPGVGFLSPEGSFYPNTAQAGNENWGPEAGKTVRDSFKRAKTENWGQPEYFVWLP